MDAALPKLGGGPFGDGRSEVGQSTPKLPGPGCRVMRATAILVRASKCQEDDRGPGGKVCDRGFGRVAAGQVVHRGAVAIAVTLRG